VTRRQPLAACRSGQELGSLAGLVDATASSACGYFAPVAAMSTGRYGALLAKEMLAVPGEAATVSEFRHGPVELVARRIGSIVFAGETGRAISLELASSIAERGGPVWLIATGGDLPTTRGVVITDLGRLDDLELPVAAAVALQRFFSAYARRLGRTPGVFAAFDPVLDTGREETRPSALGAAP
jgi:fructoselysine-6-P-deglycase FrlB-like protein